MDFAQGIDSDIEEVTTIASPSMVVRPETIATVDAGHASDAASPSPPPLQPLPSIDCVPISPIDVSSCSELTAVSAHAVPIASPLATSTYTNSSENNEMTDTDDDISQTTPLPMPLLPPIPIQQMMPKIPLVDEGEG